MASDPAGLSIWPTKDTPRWFKIALPCLVLVAVLAMGAIGWYAIQTQPPVPESVKLARLEHVERVRTEFAKGPVEVGTILTLRRGGYALVTHRNTSVATLVSATALQGSDPSIGHMLIETDNSPWFFEISSVTRPADSNYEWVRSLMLPVRSRSPYAN